MRTFIISLFLLLLAACSSNVHYMTKFQEHPDSGIHYVSLTTTEEADPRVLLIAARREAQYFCELHLARYAEIVHWTVDHHPADHETHCSAWFRCYGIYP